MKIYVENDTYKLYQGSMLDMLEVIQPKSIDSIITDPPYELNFMNKDWDNSGVAFQKTSWEKCYQVLKPGGYLLAFGGSRTFHRIACAIEDAGFEIRDTIMWLYGSGFPKSMNIGLAIDKKNGIDNRTGNIVKGVGNNNTNSMNSGVSEKSEFSCEYEERKAQNEWNGWGTALKPAYEPVIVARKSCEGSCVDNVMKYGTGGINIDECRIGDDKIITNGARANIVRGDERQGKALGYNAPHDALNEEHDGRFPSNVILTYDETDREEVIGGMPETKAGIAVRHNSGGNTFGGNNKKPQMDDLGYLDEGSAARYYYCAKASNRDRDEGLENIQATADTAKGNGLNRICEFCGAPQLKPELCRCPVKSWVLPKRKNIHPTVKPTDLMQYLVRLVTPKGGIVLDPFNGSGSTGKAVMYENKDRQANYKYIGIELTEEYLPISEARIRHASSDNQPIEIPDEPLKGQISLFDII